MRIRAKQRRFRMTIKTEFYVELRSPPNSSSTLSSTTDNVHHDIFSGTIEIKQIGRTSY